jgi:hypothetical protein
VKVFTSPRRNCRGGIDGSARGWMRKRVYSAAALAFAAISFVASACGGDGDTMSNDDPCLAAGKKAHCDMRGFYDKSYCRMTVESVEQFTTSAGRCWDGPNEAGSCPDMDQAVVCCIANESSGSEFVDVHYGSFTCPSGTRQVQP